MDEELLKAADDAISEMEDMLKAADTEVGGENDDAELAKAGDDDDDDDDDEDDDDEDDDDDDDEGMEKSLLDGLEGENGDQFFDAVPVLKSIVESDKRNRQLIKSQAVEISILNDKLDNVMEMLKSSARLSVESVKVLKSMASEPVAPQIKGQGASPALMQKSAEGKEVSRGEAKMILLKGVKDKELDRMDLVRYEQQGITTAAAEAYLNKSLKVG